MSKEFQQIESFSRGDVFALYLESLDLYVAIQIIRRDNLFPDRALAVVFDTFVKEVPELDYVKRAQPLLLTHHSLNENLLMLDTDISERDLVYIGNFEPSFAEEGDYRRDDVNHIETQYYWQELDKEVQEGIKEAKLNIRRLITTIESKSYFDELQRSAPFVYNLVSYHYFEELFAFIHDNKLITDLEISSPGCPKVLDVSQTMLTNLAIDVTGVERLVLNSRMQKLQLGGDFSKLKEIRCPFKGKYLYLRLHLKSNEIGFRGLEELRKLDIFSTVKNRIDIDNLATYLPNITQMLISGQNAQLNNVLSLEKFKNLKWLWLCDVYGFDDFPKSSSLPKLQTLWLWSVPKEVGVMGKKEFGKLPDFQTKQLRSPEWIKTNLNNPFSSWDDREGTPKGVAKKAMAAYRKAYSALLKSKEGGEARAILISFLETFNQINQKYPLETIEDEGIFAVYKELAALAEFTDKEAEGLFEQVREF